MLMKSYASITGHLTFIDTMAHAITVKTKWSLFISFIFLMFILMGYNKKLGLNVAHQHYFSTQKFSGSFI